MEEWKAGNLETRRTFEAKTFGEVEAPRESEN